MILALLAAALPALLWQQGAETAPALRDAGIKCVYVPGEKSAAWRKSGFCYKPLSQSEREALVKVQVPRVLWQANVASATRSPWIVANGWRFERLRGRTVFYDLPSGSAVLAAAEAFSYGVPAIVRIDPADLQKFGEFLTFLSTVDTEVLPVLANIGIVDDGSPLTGEVMNLLARRNLLFRTVGAPDPALDMNVRIGSAAYPKEAAANPSAFAASVRSRLTDEKRLLRIYGSELVLGRLTGDSRRLRLHLLNYGGGKIEGLRVRIRRACRPPKLRVAGFPSEAASDYLLDGESTEFSIPQMGPYAVVDLESSAAQ